MELGFNGPSGPYKPRPCGQLLLDFAKLSYFLTFYSLTGIIVSQCYIPIHMVSAS